MKKKLTLVLLLLSVYGISFSQEIEGSIPTSSHSLKNGWGIGLKAGTFGYGAELIKSLNTNFNIRGGYTGFGLTREMNLNDGTDINIDAAIGGLSLLTDWYPIKWMHITGGIIYNRTNISGTMTPLKSMNVGIIDIAQEDMGNANLQVLPGSKVSPYLALGFGRSLDLNKRLSFNAEFGTFYQGSPTAELTANGILSPTGSEEQNLQLNNNLANYYLYPIISFQLSFLILK